MGKKSTLAMSLILIDNFDSFSHNIAQYFAMLGAPPIVLPNTTTIDQISALKPRAIVVGPGPCTPNEAGVSLGIFGLDVPILGVCLGHQAMAQAFGARVIRGHAPMHAVISPMIHDGSALFDGVPSPFMATRYHSLVVANLPDCLMATAHSDDGAVMAIQHKTRLIYGVQFHPESIASEHGMTIFANFLALST